MFPGLGNMNPAQMKKMLQQFGIKSEDLAAKRVVFELEGKNLVIENPAVTVVDMQGQKTYTVMGTAKEQSAGIPAEDVQLVAEQAKVNEAAAKKALEEADGDIAEAIAKLKK